jgi:hypothetical protein
MAKPFSYSRSVENQSDRIDSVTISDTAEQLSVMLSAGDHPLVLVRMIADALAEDVINGDGVVVPGAVNSWTLLGRTLTLEYNRAGAGALGFARVHTLLLDISVAEIEQLCDALLEILETACCAVETPAGRIIR